MYLDYYLDGKSWSRTCFKNAKTITSMEQLVLWEVLVVKSKMTIYTVIICLANTIKYGCLGIGCNIVLPRKCIVNN